MRATSQTASDFVAVKWFYDIVTGVLQQKRFFWNSSVYRIVTWAIFSNLLIAIWSNANFLSVF